MSDRHDDKRGPRRVPLLPLRDIIVFPHMVVPLFVGREKSISALDEAMGKGGAATRRSSSPRSARPRPTSRSPEDIFTVGTRRHDHPAAAPARRHGEGARRGQAARRDPALHPDRRRSSSSRSRRSPTRSERSVEVEALMRSVQATFEIYVKLNKRIAPEILMLVQTIDDPARLADTIVAHLQLKLADQQALLEMDDAVEAPRAALRADAGRDRDPPGREEDPLARQEADGEDAEGVLPQRADAGDPEGARRARRVQERDQGARGARQAEEPVEGGARRRSRRS